MKRFLSFYKSLTQGPTLLYNLHESATVVFAAATGNLALMMIAAYIPTVIKIDNIK